MRIPVRGESDARDGEEILPDQPKGTHADRLQIRIPKNLISAIEPLLGRELMRTGW